MLKGKLSENYLKINIVNYLSSFLTVYFFAFELENGVTISPKWLLIPIANFYLFMLYKSFPSHTNRENLRGLARPNFSDGNEAQNVSFEILWQLM